MYYNKIDKVKQRMETFSACPMSAMISLYASNKLFIKILLLSRWLLRSHYSQFCIALFVSFLNYVHNSIHRLFKQMPYQKLIHPMYSWGLKLIKWQNLLHIMTRPISQIEDLNDKKATIVMNPTWSVGDSSLRQWRQKQLFFIS